MTDRPDSLTGRGPASDTTPDPVATHGPHEHGAERNGPRWGHHLMMLACCVPMLVIVGALVVSGAVGTGAIVYALICVAMMAAMMLFMPGHKH